MRRPLLVWLSAAAVAVTLVGLLFAAPLSLASGHEFTAQAIYQAFSRVCHQIPERSFHIAGHSLAVCARCTGLYVGLAAGVLFYPLLRSLRSTETPARFWLFVAAVPMGIDFLLGFFGIWENTHLSRFVTGVLLGAVAALFIVPGLVDLSRTNLRRFFGHSPSHSKKLVPPTEVATSAPSAPSDYSYPSSRI